MGDKINKNINKYICCEERERERGRERRRERDERENERGREREKVRQRREEGEKQRGRESDGGGEQRRGREADGTRPADEGSAGSPLGDGAGEAQRDDGRACRLGRGLAWMDDGSRGLVCRWRLTASLL